MTFELFPRRTIRGRRWYWRLVARNGEIVAQSEGYRNKGNAILTINRIRTAAAHAPIAEREGRA